MTEAPAADTPAEPKLVPEPWRKLGRGLDWNEQTREALLREVTEYTPLEHSGVGSVRVLMLGQVGAGKSSFFNTINSIFRGYVTAQAPAGSETHSYTTRFRVYEVHKVRGGEPLNVRLCDTMGLEETEGMDLADFPYILDGHVQDFFQFNPSAPVTPDHPDYEPAPKVKDKIHLVVCVVDSVTWAVLPQTIHDKLMALKKKAKDRGVPVAILLTKVDKLSPVLVDDVTKVFHSVEVRDIVDSVAGRLGIPRSHILPIKNYEKELDLELGEDILALLTLRQMLRLADGFLDELIAKMGKSAAAIPKT